MTKKNSDVAAEGSIQASDNQFLSAVESLSKTVSKSASGVKSAPVAKKAASLGKKVAKKAVKKKVAAETSSKTEELLTELLGRLDAIETRLDVAESARVPAIVSKNEMELLAEDISASQALAKRQVALPQSMVGQPMDDSVIDRYTEIQQRREAQAAKNHRIPRSKSTTTQELRQRLRELEGQPSSSARMRLQDMKVRGTLKDFKILPPGSNPPRDFNEQRALVTVDQYGLVLATDIG